MYCKLHLVLASLLIIISCGEVKKTQEKVLTIEDKLNGFWERIGTIQTVKGKAVDTVYIKDTDPEYRQIKVFHKGNVAWINNVYDPSNDWKSGSGMYGKFKIDDNIITETISHATGGAISWLWGGGIDGVVEIDDKKDVRPTPFKFSIDNDLLLYDFVNDDQEGESLQTEFGENYIELWKRLPDVTPNTSKIDGIWKRTFEIQYVNNIPIDTISVPNDGKLDIHFRLNGRFIYQVDNTGMSDPDDILWWGHGGYGEYEFIGENSIKEYGEFFSGGQYFPKRERRQEGSPFGADTGTRNFDFYNDDLFLQTQLDSLGNIYRGVVYGRVK